MEVLILSKTHMGALACVGGIILDSLRPIRLHSKKDGYQPGDTELKVGQIWDIDFDPHPIKAPHVEDVIVNRKRLIKEHIDIASFVKNKCVIWNGNLQTLFGGVLKWTNKGSGYVNLNSIPKTSVGFWVCDRDLTYENGHYLYPKKILAQKHIKYIGYEPARGIIPAGTVIRVSLAKWWKPEDVDMELRCYLQLSGWY